MTSKPARLWLLLWPLSVAPAYSGAIQNLTFSEVVKDVVVINVATKAEAPAKAGDILVPPNVLKTGPDSRAELIAEDKTVTRVGANTIFSVEADSRDVNIAQGSVLFNSPKGKGGGRIKSAGATASVLGTTVQVGANSQAGGMKVMVMEGKAALAGASGASSTLAPGQLSFIQAGKPPTAPLNFDLKANVSANKLVGGFSKPLASIAKIEAAASVQQAKIASGALASTGLVIGDRPDLAFKVDVSSLQSVITEVIAQVAAAAETETASRTKVDPRYVTAVAKALTLTSAIAPEDSIFSIDGSGVTPEGFGAPKKIPGARGDLGTIAALIGKNITLTLSALPTTADTSGIASTSPYLLLSPVMEKDAGAVVALNDLNISGSIDIAGFETVRVFPNLTGATLTATSKTVTLSSIYGLQEGMTITGTGIPSGTIITAIDAVNSTVTLSNPATEAGAGVELFAVLPGAIATLNQKTVTIAPEAAVGLLVGMTVSGDAFPSGTTITEISKDGKTVTLSAAATQTKTADLTLGGVTSGTPLVLSAGHTINLALGSFLRANTSLLDIYAAGTSFAANVDLTEQSSKIKAPLVIDSAVLLNDWSLSESSKMAGVLRIKAPSISVIDSKIQAGEVQLESDGAISVSSHGYANLSAMSVVPLGIESLSDLVIAGYTVGITSTSDSVSLTGVTFKATDATLSAGDQLTLSGVTYTAMDSSDQSLTASAVNDVAIASSNFTSLVNASITSTAGKVTVTDSQFGTGQEVVFSDAALKTMLSIEAKKALLLTNSPLNADTISLTSSTEDVTVSNTSSVAIRPTDSGNGSFTALSKLGNVSMSKSDIYLASVKITAGGDIVDTTTLSNNGQNSPAAAKDKAINLTAVNFYAQSVALDAATIILEGVSFKAGSAVYLNSFHGLVAANPGYTENNPVKRGFVNFRSNVKYGDYTILINSDGQNMTPKQFKDAATAAAGTTVNINVGTQKGRATIPTTAN